GIRYVQKALRLSPRDPMRWAMMVLIAYALLRLERYEEALDWARRATREPHAVFWPYAHVVVCLVALERIDEAREALAELLRIEPKLTIQSIESSAGYVTDRKTQERYTDALRKAGLPE
ncbi:MAG: tetratricopeptide repeat protein, partial [Alphaproteobacteria bacterium]